MPEVPLRLLMAPLLEYCPLVPVPAHHTTLLLAIQAPKHFCSLAVLCAQAFVNQVSGHEGAEVPAGLDPDVSFDDPAFWRELKAALGVAADKHSLDLDVGSESAPSSDGFSDDDDSDDSDDSDLAPSSDSDTKEGDLEQPQYAEASSRRQAPGIYRNNLSPSFSQHQPPASQTNYTDAAAMPYGNDAEADGDSASGSEVLTATDSDDDEAGFMRAYDDVLAEELSSSRVGSILQSAPEEGDHQGSQAGVEAGSGNDVKPLDLDTNLVRNLLQSYTAQQGLAGPAGNLAGLLGLNLPDNAQTE